MVELRFRCPEDVHNTLIHHTKMKFMVNAAKQCVENVNHWYPVKVLGNWLVQGKSSSLGARGQTGDRVWGASEILW